MKNFLLFICMTVITSFSDAQIEGSELGIDLTFSYSSGLYNNGTVGIGGKYGLLFNEESIILGPSVRYHRTWTNNPFNTTNASTGFNIFGGGGFIHYRFAKYLFVGTEFEVLRSPYTNNGTLSLSKPKWVPTLLLGGGFSGMIGDNFRVNAGVMYDILDIPNPPTKYPDSPLQPYVARNKTTGVVIPIIYRIAFFIPLSQAR